MRDVHPPDLESANRALQAEVAERRRAEQVSRGQVAALVRALHFLAAEPDLERFLGQALRAIAEQMRAPSAGLWLYPPAPDAAPLYVGFWGGEVRAAAAPSPAANLPWLRGGAAHAEMVRNRCPLLYEDVARHPDLAPLWDWFPAEGARSLLVVPLFQGNELIGSLCLGDTAAPCRPEELELAQALAHQAALAVQVSRLTERDRRRSDELAGCNAALRQEVTSREASERFARSTLDALTAHIAILDHEGVILAVNKAWRHFAGANAAAGRVSEGANYLRACDRAAGPDAEEARHAAEGVRAVLNGERKTFTLEYPCHSGQEQRWFSLRVTRFPGAGRARAVVAHENITDRRRAEEALRRAHDELEAKVRQRTAELAKANEALRRSLHRLTSERDLDAFLGQVLRETARETGAVRGHIFTYDPSGNALVARAAVREGEVFLGPAPDDPGLFRAPFPADITDAFPLACRRRDILFLSAAEFEGNAWPGTAAWHHACGHREAAFLALVAGEEPVGALGLCFTDRAGLPADWELIHALANQAALAIQLIRLAEQAKQAAVAREQEKAARERAAELAKANEALRNSLGRLAGERAPEAFLRHILLEARVRLGAQGAALFRYDPSTHTLAMALTAADDLPADPAGAEGLDSFVRPTPADVTPYWQALLDGRRPVVLDAHDPACEPLFWPGTREWHLRNNQPVAVGVPLLLGDEPLGFVGVSFAGRVTVTAEQQALLQALAHQATLALQLTRLAKRAEQAAVVEERNRMAREIHDTLAQAFTGILMQVEVAQRVLARKPEGARDHMARAAALAREALVEARRSVHALSSDGEEYADLAAALARYADQMTAGTPVRAEVGIQGTPRPLPPDVATDLLRIGREALTNALRHARAGEVLLELAFEGQEVRLRVRDDGQGFDVGSASGAGGRGLRSMRERAERLGGHLALTSGPGQGTEVAVTVAAREAEGGRAP